VYSEVSNRISRDDPGQRVDVPNAVPNDLGTSMSRRSTAVAHILNASIGTGRSSTNVGGSRKADTIVVTNLANARVPKYAPRILFLKVIAYTLGRGLIGWIGDLETKATP